MAGKSDGGKYRQSRSDIEGLGSLPQSVLALDRSENQVAWDGENGVLGREKESGVLGREGVVLGRERVGYLGVVRKSSLEG